MHHNPPTVTPSLNALFRIQGVVTRLALKNQVWVILEQIAHNEQLSLVEFISTLYQEIIGRQGEIKNLASMLRVTCSTY